MFILEGVRSVILRFVVFEISDGRTGQGQVAQTGTTRLAGQGNGRRGRPTERHSLKEVLGTLISWKVTQLALVYFELTTGLYGIELWMPLLASAMFVISLRRSAKVSLL